MNSENLTTSAAIKLTVFSLFPTKMRENWKDKGKEKRPKSSIINYKEI